MLHQKGKIVYLYHVRMTFFNKDIEYFINELSVMGIYYKKKSDFGNFDNAFHHFYFDIDQ